MDGDQANGGRDILEDALERRYEWTKDPHQVAAVAEDVLVAAGVTSDTAARVHSLAGSHQTLARLQGVGGVPDASLELDELGSLPSAELDRTLAMFADAHAVIGALLDRLAVLGVRTEIIGVATRQLRTLHERFGDVMRSEAWRRRDGAELDRQLAALADEDLDQDWGGDVAVPATRQEIATIVGVLKAMPSASLKKISPVTSSVALRAIVTALLKGFASDSQGASDGAAVVDDGALDEPDGGTPRAAPVTIVRVVDPSPTGPRAPTDPRSSVQPRGGLTRSVVVLVVYASLVVGHLVNYEVHYFGNWRFTMLPVLGWVFVVAALLASVFAFRQLRRTRAAGPRQWGSSITGVIAGATVASVVWFERSFPSRPGWPPVLGWFPPDALTTVVVLAGFAPLVAALAGLLVAHRPRGGVGSDDG